VGIQFAWNLRPFLCDKTEDFKLFRKYEGNFYTAIVYSVKQLIAEDEAPESYKMKTPMHIIDSMNAQQNDTTDVFNVFK
jgi:hypothetical protein